MVKENISKKQSEIIELLYRFRFLNRYQIQQLLNHKKISRVNIWLKNLYDRKIISRIYSKESGGNTTSAIYYLKSLSKNYLEDQLKRDNKFLKRVYGEKNRSLKFVNHCLLSADFYLELKKSHLTQEVFFYTKIDLLNYSYLPAKHPDAYVAIKKNKDIKRYFFEIIDEGMPRFTLRAKIKQYLEYFDSNIWVETTKHPFPKILILCPNEVIKKYLHSHISKLMEEENKEDPQIYLSTEASNRWTSALKETDDS